MRAQFVLGQQRGFFDTIQRITGHGPDELANLLGVSARTLRDWRRERWQMSEDALDQLCALAGLPRPKGIVVLPEHWSVHKAGLQGARRRYVKVRKSIRCPLPSEALAEFIGIFLGDGGFRNAWQISIAFNIHGDRPYAAFISQLVAELFELRPSCFIRPQLGVGSAVSNRVSPWIDGYRWINLSAPLPSECQGLFLSQARILWCAANVTRIC